MRNMKTEFDPPKVNTMNLRTNIYKMLFLAVISVIVSSLLMTDLSIDRFLGGALISFVLLFILYRDIMRYKPSYINNYNMLVLLCLLLIGTLLIGRISGYLLESLSKGLVLVNTDISRYGIPIAAGAMFVTLLFDFHSSITFSFTLSLLTGFWLNDPLFPVYTFVGSLTASFSVIRCKKRSALLRGGLYIIMANVTLVLILLLAKGDLFTTQAGTPSSLRFSPA